jgi:RNA polymerase sigma factor FliA
MTAYLDRQVSVEDLCSVGVLGLVDASHRFDPARRTYSGRMRNSASAGRFWTVCGRSDWSPRELGRKGRPIEQAIQTLTGQFRRSPTDIEIAQKLNISLISYQQLKGLEIGTLYSERFADSVEENVIYLPGRPGDDPPFRYLDAEMRQLLTQVINDLPERARMVMTLYYYQETTMKEIGFILGVVESRVSQIDASAVSHLRAGLSSPKAYEESRPH